MRAASATFAMVDSFKVYEARWATRAPEILRSCNSSYKAQAQMKARQVAVGMPEEKLKLLYATRWLGFPIAFHRLKNVVKDEEVKKIIGYDITDADEQEVEEVLPVLDICASLISESPKKIWYRSYGRLSLRLLLQTHTLC